MKHCIQIQTKQSISYFAVIRENINIILVILKACTEENFDLIFPKYHVNILNEISKILKFQTRKCNYYENSI